MSTYIRVFSTLKTFENNLCLVELIKNRNIYIYIVFSREKKLNIEEHFNFQIYFYYFILEI